MRLVQFDNLRRGFTLIECMAVMFVIGVLVALILPALQASRSASDRVGCVNNLKNIGIALQNYESSHNFFPGVALISGRVREGFVSEHTFSVLSRTLAELEQTQLHQSINFALSPTSGFGLWANYTAMSLSLGVAVCPGDRGQSTLGYGRSNYRFNVGSSPWIAPSPWKPDAEDGAFTVHRAYTPSAFRDGMSQTACASERLQGNWTPNSQFRGNYAVTSLDDWNTISPTLVRMNEVVISRCLAGSPSESIESRSGESWLLSGYHFTNYNHCVTPNVHRNGCSLYSFMEDIHWRTLHEGVFGATSNHPLGVNVLLMDGHVQFVRDSVGQSIWRALSTRASGDILSDSL